MKANAGGTVTGEAILGREIEIAEIWGKLERRSVVFNAERRVGKTCVLRKMAEHPQAGWIPILCWVESGRHPIDCVETIYSECDRLMVRAGKDVWLDRVKSAYKKITAGTEIKGWRLPQIESGWKHLLSELVEGIVESTDNRVLLILDEFPLLVANIIDADTAGPKLGMELLDTLREIRQRFEGSGQIRFLISGSIGLHLILKQLKATHGYRNNPTNNMAITTLGGMSMSDTKLMCESYLEEEGITRRNPSDFDKRMFQLTDGLPLYIQHVCEEFQLSRRTEVTADDIDTVLREMLDSSAVEWFKDAADRIDTYYAELHDNHRALAILKMLCRGESFVAEPAIIESVRSQVTVEYDEEVLSTLELLWRDHYLVRDTSQGGRRYRFKYNLMRRWWKLNRG